MSEDYSISDYFKEFIVIFNQNPKFSLIINERIEEIIYEIFIAENDLERSINLLEELTENFNINFDKINTENIRNRLDDLFSEHNANESQWLLDWLTDEYEANEKINEVEKLVKRINDLGFEYEANMDDFNFDWYEVACENEFARQMAKDD